ncbi:MAG: hypothetical protein ACKVT1_05705, partial [Dehalococcoidia bacterium]
MADSVKAQLYQQFAPDEALDPGDSRYVDWPSQVDVEDAKSNLASSIALGGTTPQTRLITGHRGTGKTTELKRVKRLLESGEEGRKIFVSILPSEEWLALEDVDARDIVFQVVRQLVDDLAGQGFKPARARFDNWFKDLAGKLNVRLQLDEIDLKVAKLSVVTKESPQARKDFRELLEPRMPAIFDLINDVIRGAKEWLAQHGAYDDILVIIDELDRIPVKEVQEGVTNHERIFLDSAGPLRALACHTLYTVPIELAYSECRVRLETTYGGEIINHGVVPVLARDGTINESALAQLRSVVLKRLERAALREAGVFGEGQLDALCRASGGHLRYLFLLLRSAINRSDLPIPVEVIEYTVLNQARSAARVLDTGAWEVVRGVHRSKDIYEDDRKRFFGLL